jgi:hypothetical protein
MSDLDEFLGSVETRQRDAEVALLNGDAEPRLAIWSRNDPVTLLGACTRRPDGTTSATRFAGWAAPSPTADFGSRTVPAVRGRPALELREKVDNDRRPSNFGSSRR